MVETTAEADPQIQTRSERAKLRQKKRAKDFREDPRDVKTRSDRAALKKKKRSETPKEKTSRHWLRGFMVRALAVDPPLKNLPLDADGFVKGTTIISAAAGAEGSPDVPAKMETLILIASQSGGTIEKMHDEEKGFFFRARSRIKEEKVEKRSFSKNDTEKLISKEKAAMKKRLEKKREENAKRAAESEKRMKASAAKREENRQKRLKAARQRQLADTKNERRIASPNDPKVLARIAPPLKRLGKGTSVADARQAVTDRKKK